MAKARDLEAELRSVQETLMRTFRRTFPSKQFQAELLLGTISLEITLKRLSQTRDLNERRKLKSEFDHGVSVLRRGMRMLWRSRWGDEPMEPEQAAQTGGLFS